MKKPGPQAVPLIGTLRTYRSELFRADLIAGLTVAVMLIPQSMAYAALAGLPPVAGLYASVVPLVAYALLGTSGSLAVGPVAIVSLLTAAALAPMAGDDPVRYGLLAATLALMVGAVQVVLGLVRAGRLVAFLSHGVISGFTSAAAIVIAISQIPSLLGLDVPRHEGFVDRVVAIAGALDETHLATAVIGVGAVAALVGLRHWFRRIPAALLVVIGTTVVVWVLSLDQAGVAVLGEVPRGLSAPTLPSTSWDSVTRLLPAALTIAVIGYAEGIGIAKAIATRTRETVRPNTELLAVGAANVTAGLFSAFPVAGGLSRTAVNHEAGAKTPVASLVTAATIAATVAFLTPLFTFLPRAVLAAVVIAAVLRLVDVGEAVRLFRYRRVDALVLAGTFLVTLLVSVEAGLAAGLVASLLVFVARASKPHIAELGRMPGTDAFRNRTRYDVELDPHVVVLRVDGPLFYASAQTVRDRVVECTIDRPGVRGLVLDASAMTDIDSDGVHVLEELVADLSAAGIGLALATVRGPVRDLIARSPLAGELADKVAPDIDSAIGLVSGRAGEPAWFL